MRKLFLFLTLLLALTTTFGGDAKNVSFHTNDVDATYLVFMKTEFSPEIIQWESDGTATVTLSNDKGVNVNLNTGYISQYISVNGEEVVKSFSGSFYLTPEMLPDGCTVEIMTSVKQAVNVIVKGNPDQINVRYMYHSYEPSEWRNGELHIPITDNYLNVVIEAREGYGISSVTYGGKDVYAGDINTYTIISSNLEAGDNVYEVGSFLLADERTSTFSVDVTGLVSLVELVRAGDSSNVITGEALEEPISFNPVFDLPVLVRNVHYNQDFYKVTVGGVDIPAENNVYRIFDLKDGDVVKVEVDYPDVQVPVRLGFVNTETEGAISNVHMTLNGVDKILPAGSWLEEGWSVPMGAVVTIALNETDYTVSATLNGVEVEGAYVQFVVKDEAGYDVEVTAVPLDPFEVIVSYESLPAHFKVCVGVTGEDYVEMTGRDSTRVSVPRNRNRIRIIPDEGWVIESVVVDGNESNSDDIPITGSNMYIDVFMQEYERDLEAVFYLDPATEWGFMGIRLSPEVQFREKSLSLESGYNVVKYNEADLPLAMEVMVDAGYDYPCFLNGVQLPMPVMSVPELLTGSVVRCYGDYPAFYNVDFNVASDASVTMTRDLIDTLENPENQKVMAGTRYDIIPEDISEVIVKVNGVLQEAEEGRYVVMADSDLEIEVAKGNPSGISSLVDTRVCTDVFSLQGIRILKNATASQIRRLPAGLYIVNGRKVVVK